MIAWTIPATLFVTGATSASSTSSSSSSESNSTLNSDSAGAPFSSNSYEAASSRSYSESASTTHGAAGTTTYFSSSSIFSFSSSSTYRVLDSPFSGSSSFTDSFSTSGSSSSSTAIPSYSVQTSTTKTFVEYIVNTTASSIHEEDVAYGYYTTSKSDSNAVVEFVETLLPKTVWYEEGQNETITRDSTTLLSSTTLAGAAATVVQAFTNFVPYGDGYHQAPEVLYFISDPQTSWNGYAPATNAAQSGTRFTVWPSYSTVLVVPVNGANDTTQSTSNNSSSFSSSWRASTSAQETQTRATHWRLPNSTETFTRSRATTTSSTASGIVFASNVITFGRVDAGAFNTTSSVTTLAVISYSTIPTTVARRYGSLTFESQVPSTVSSNRIITTSTAATNQTSASATNYADNTTYEAAKRTTASGSGISISGVQTVYGPAQISTAAPPQLSRSLFATSGAVVNNSTGLWFTAIGGSVSSPFILTAMHGSGRLGMTIFPTTNSEITISGNSVTWLQTYEEASNNTTSSLVVSVSGTSYTVVDTTTFGAPLHHGGGLVGKGCTVVDVAGVGAYKDRIGGETASFSGAATVLTEGQSQPIKSWFPVTAISPLSLREARHGITFSAPRNEMGLPPIPLDAFV
jgi:hypothetical protein